MTEKKLSRRDAMKVLGAAIGATALANLPSKWDTPELAQGVLPAHARQSVAGGIAPAPPVVVTSLKCGEDTGFIGPNPRIQNVAAGEIYADILPVAAGVPVSYSYAIVGDATSLLPPSGVWLTDGSGRVNSPAFDVNVGAVPPADMTFTLSSGGFSCTQTLSFV